MNDYIIINDDNTECYSVVNRKGLNSFLGTSVGFFLGPLTHATANAIAGEGQKRKTVLIKLKNVIQN